MSEIMDKITPNKKFESKSINHIRSYSLVKQLEGFLLSFSLVNILYQYAISAIDFVNTKLSSVDVVYDSLTFVDEKVDGIILSKVDWGVKQVPPSDKLNPVVYARAAYDYINTSILRPINNMIYNAGDKVLPATVGENKAVFKLEELGESSEVSKFFKIINEFVSRAKTFVSNKSNDVSNNLISTYNDELNTMKDEASVYKKKLVAGYNTGYRFVSDVNNQTQEYVADVATTTKNKADSLISDAKQGISAINGKANEIRNEGAELLNGSSSSNQAPAVSASA